jgi:hypothetical protein
MIAFASSKTTCPKNDWQAGFLNMLPTIKRLARCELRKLRGEAREDATVEVLAHCLCAYRRLCERNEVNRAFASILVRYAVLHYHRGRRVGTSQCSRDVYSHQAKHASACELLPIGTPGEQCGGWKECLSYNRASSIPDQVHFRLEFPRWLQALTPRNRLIVETLSLGYTTAEVAQRYELSPARVSQLRREFYESWNQFSGEVPRRTLPRAGRTS